MPRSNGPMSAAELRHALDQAADGAASWAVNLTPDAPCHVRCGGEDHPAAKITVEFVRVAGRWAPVIHTAPLARQEPTQ